MVQAKQVDTTEVDLGCLHKSDLLQQAAWQIVVHFHIAEFQESTVTLPKGTGLIVVGIARRGETRESAIHVGVRGTPTTVVVLLRE